MHNVIHWGDWVGAGDSLPDYCTVGAVAKRNSPGALPYVVANELICSRLGMMAAVPVVPGALLQNTDECVYLSMRFGPAGERPPPAIVEDVVRHAPDSAAAVVVFDLLIANEDRHDENIAFHRGKSGHGEFLAFDHDRALLGTTGAARLSRLIKQPTVAGCLANHIVSRRDLREWATHIGQLTTKHFQLAIDPACVAGLINQEESTAVLAFLGHRGAILRELLEQAMSNGLLPSLENQLLLPP